MSCCETCPICLECINEGDNVLEMPVCKHKIHTLCELKAAQYDSRCPVCRTKHPDITTRQEDDIEMYANIERIAADHERMIGRYNQRRYRAIQKNPRLKLVQCKLKEEKRNLKRKDDELSREWLRVQKDCWNNDPDISRLKDERRKQQRRTSRLCRELEHKLEEELGPRPHEQFFTIN